MTAISSRTGEKMIPVLYCDLDDAILKGPDELEHGVSGPKDVELFPQIAQLLWAYRRAGWRIISCSNKGEVALGHMSTQACMAIMVEVQKQAGQAFDKMIWCIHHPQADSDEMAVCWCRKPRPGMIIESALALASETGEIYPPHMALFVGGGEDGLYCARTANVPFLEAEQWRTGSHLYATLHSV